VKTASRIFMWGMVISFLGALPPGIMNLAAIQIESREGAIAAIVYAFGSMLAEVFIVRIALSFMSWLTRSRRFFQWLEWMTAAMLVAFSAVCFITANSMSEFPVALPGMALPAFVTGILLSVINPLHIPFWMGWSTILMNKGILLPRSGQYNWYIGGIAMGTMVGFAVFIYAGRYLLHAFHENQLIINCTLGSILLLAAFMQVKKMVRLPLAVRHARVFKQ
jgi:threonine/homoserine/homoserine lactone efflux protein